MKNDDKARLISYDNWKMKQCIQTDVKEDQVFGLVTWEFIVLRR